VRSIYPGRPDHPQAKIAQKQMRGGSTLVAFDIDGGKKAAFRFQDALKLIRISNNLGDAKSLITHPATTTHQRLTPAQRAELGITDGLVRVSVGLEHPDDIVDDVLADPEYGNYRPKRAAADAIGRVAASAMPTASSLATHA
jgi:O-succinylhomoserine sulfhydrylase